MMRWILLAAGCSAATLLGMAVGFYTTFPSEEAAAYAEYHFHARNKDYALEVGEVSPWWVPGVRAIDVTVYTVKRARRTKDVPKPGLERTPLLSLDSLAVRAQLLPLMTGQESYGFNASLIGGDVDGHFAQSDASTELSFTASGLDLSRMPIEKDSVMVRLAGTLSGKSDLVLDSEDVKASTGAISLSFDGLKLDEGTKVMGLAVPVVTFTSASVRLEATEGKLVVTDGTFDGDVLDMTLSGDISLNKKLARSRNRLELTVTLPEELDKLAKIAPTLKRARDPEGAYHFNIGGTILSPTFRAGKGAAAGLASREEGGEPRIGGLGGGGAAEGGDDISAEDAREERRKRREERIAERRERLRKRREEAAANGGGGAIGEQGEDDPMLDEMDEPRIGRRPPPNRGEDDVEGGDFDMGPGAPQMDMPDMGPPPNAGGPDEFEE